MPARRSRRGEEEEDWEEESGKRKEVVTKRRGNRTEPKTKQNIDISINNNGTQVRAARKLPKVILRDSQFKPAHHGNGTGVPYTVFYLPLSPLRSAEQNTNFKHRSYPRRLTEFCSTASLMKLATLVTFFVVARLRSPPHLAFSVHVARRGRGN